jgi:hypothetical protein
VEIKNFSVQNMEALIRWIYLGNIEDKRMVEDIFVLAETYMIEDLKVSTFLKAKKFKFNLGTMHLVYASGFDHTKCCFPNFICSHSQGRQVGRTHSCLHQKPEHRTDLSSLSVSGVVRTS